MAYEEEKQFDVSGQRVLTDREKEWILEDTFQSVQIDQTLRKVEMTRREFSLYLKRDPEFAEAFRQAELDACQFLENDMINIYKNTRIDHKMARVAIESINKVLVFRNPQKYSQKIDLNLQHTISIRSNIDAGNRRISALMKDVTPEPPPVIEAPKSIDVSEVVKEQEKEIAKEMVGVFRDVLLK